MSEARENASAGRPVTAAVFLAGAAVLMASVALIYWVGLVPPDVAESQAANHRSGQATRERSLAFLGTALLNLVVLALAYRRLTREMRQRHAAQTLLARHARLIDLAPSATIVSTVEGTITFWSDGAEKLYGWTRQEAVGRLTHDLLRTEFPEELPRIVARLRRGGKWSGELRHHAKDGRTVIVESHWLGQLTPDGEVLELLESNMDVTGRKRTEEELRRLKDELEQRVEQRTAELAAANKELEAFGYSVSHDLRAPLRHVSNYIKLLEQGAGPTLDDESRRQVRTIAEAAQRMGHLIDDLLVLSRIGRVSLTEGKVSLRQLVDDARKELAPEMAGRAIEWRIGALPQVRGDTTLLSTVIVNLLSNALKYTRRRDPARIEVGCHQHDGEIVCFVKDNGAGFDMRFVDKLFGVFQRLHDRHQFEGTGIGLASVRRIVQRHGGRTWAEGAVDRGATFYFSLPRERAPDGQGDQCGVRNAECATLSSPL